MSRNMNAFKSIIDRGPKDGHKIINYNYTEPLLYCPIVKDNIYGINTTAGFICTHCNKHIVT